MKRGRGKLAAAAASVLAAAGVAAMTVFAQTNTTQASSTAKTQTTSETQQTAPSAVPNSMDQGYEITVSGSAETLAEPDRAEIRFGFESDVVDTAAEAQKAISKKITSVRKALVKAGIPEDSIKTTSYTMSPTYDYAEDSRGEIDGYEASAVMTVSDVEIDKTADAITAATKAGADRVSHISYTNEDYDALYNETLVKAEKAAKKKAEAMAKAMNMTVGKAKNIEEGYQDTSARYVTGDSSTVSTVMLDGIETSSTADLDLDPESLNISAEVTMTFVLQ